MGSNTQMEEIRRTFYRDQLRSARAVALADAEGFQSILHVVELIGQQLLCKVGSLGEYKSHLATLASDSALYLELPCQWPGCHTEFNALYDELLQARNDAMHQGAFARTLTQHAVELTNILEDALMLNASTASQFMVRNVVEAKPWHPISYVRQQMLTNAFSYLPIRHQDQWKLIPDYSIARYLRNTPKTIRKKRLATTVQEAVEKDALQLIGAHSVTPNAAIAEIVQQIADRPVMVIDSEHGNSLVGVLTASDVL